MLTGKNITVGIAGGIAAYKAAELVSGLVKLGANVQVVMTASAQEFLKPLTFSALTGHEVHVDMFSSSHEGGVVHIDLAQKADLIIVAPATANILAKSAHGLADELLSTVIVAANGPVMFCPAMNSVMYNNPVVQQNIKQLQQLGYHFVGPNSGFLACGAVGSGRMAEPKEILAEVQAIFQPEDLTGVRVLVSAGPTREPLDPVRYLTNHSSGKMGYSIAQVARERGAKVTLVSGPVFLPPPKGVNLINVETAQEMHQAMLRKFASSQVVIMSAAVADYRPKQQALQKIKKHNDEMNLQLEKNPDILAHLGQLKEKQILVGFAAETENLEEYAVAKLKQKNLDFLVANDVSLPGAGFNVDTNIVKLFYAGGQAKELPVMSKYQVAQIIMDEVVEKLY